MMATETVTTWTCDRDGVVVQLGGVAPDDEDPPLDPPEPPPTTPPGWRTVVVMGIGDPVTSGTSYDLCDGCAAEHMTFMAGPPG